MVLTEDLEIVVEYTGQSFDDVLIYMLEKLKHLKRLHLESLNLNKSIVNQIWKMQQDNQISVQQLTLIIGDIY